MCVCVCVCVSVCGNEKPETNSVKMLIECVLEVKGQADAGLISIQTRGFLMVWMCGFVGTL